LLIAKGTIYVNQEKKLSRQSEYFLFRAKQKFPVLSFGKEKMGTVLFILREQILFTI